MGNNDIAKLNYVIHKKLNKDPITERETFKCNYKFESFQIKIQVNQC